MSNFKFLADQLRSDLILSNIVGRSVNLKKHGKEYTGLCPFHHEKTPSFTVNNEKSFYHCFGCGAHGDVIKFLMEIKRLDFIEAIEILAIEANLDFKKYIPKKDIIENNKSELEILYEINEVSCKWFEANIKTDNEINIVKYTETRGINKIYAEKFRLGYSGKIPYGLKNFLLKEKFSLENSLKAGMLVKDQNDLYYDRFRNRLIFPIFDVKGKIIAFGGRALDNNPAKYLNSPETYIFHKSKILYGENFARNNSKNKKRIILVEGYIDVIMMHQTGFSETVAALGTAVTKDHLIKLWKISDEVIIFLDGDLAAQNSMIRISELALEVIEPGFSVKFAINNTGKDPADLCKNNDVKMIDFLVENALILSEFLWVTKRDKFIKEKTPEEITILEKDIVTTISRIKDNKMKNNFKLFFQEKIWSEIRKKNPSKQFISPVRKSNLLNLKELSYNDHLEYSLIILVINIPDLLKDEEIFEEFSQFKFSDPVRELISREIVSYYLNNIKFSNFNFTKELIIVRLKSIIPKDIDFLFKDNCYFIDKDILKTYSKAIIVFKVILLKKELSDLKIEHELYLKEFTEEATEKARIIYSEIELLKEKIQKLELLNYD